MRTAFVCRLASTLLSLNGTLLIFLMLGWMSSTRNSVSLSALTDAPACSGLNIGQPECDPRRDPSLLLGTATPAHDAMLLPALRRQYRHTRFAAAMLATARTPAQVMHWRGLETTALYNYRIMRLEITSSALRRAHLPDI